MPQTLFVLLLTMFLQSAQTPNTEVPSSAAQTSMETATRDPFTLKLKLPGGSHYQEQVDATPYIKDGAVSIFPGESFGVNLKIDGERITDLSYEKKSDKADIRLKFTEESAGKGVIMMLVIENKIKQTLYLDAFMQVPDRKGEYKTSVLPVFGGKAGFESWPHPIKLLVLRNLRFTSKPTNQ